MTSRMFAASIVLLGIGSTVAPVEASAGSGGLIAAPSFSARGAVHPSVTAPLSARTSLPHGVTGEPRPDCLCSGRFALGRLEKLI
jgi:hypothetical protein